MWPNSPKKAWAQFPFSRHHQVFPLDNLAQEMGPNCKGKIIPTTIFFPKGKKMKTISNNEDVIQGRRRLLRKKFEPKIFYTNHLFSPLHHNWNTNEKKLDENI
jgi:hypothetical protein